MGVAGLYAGIGGFELGFQAAGFRALLLADKDMNCRKVLSARFPGTAIVGDVADIDTLPAGTEIVTAGFPCQNLSMAGDKKGIEGSKSSDVNHLFELLRRDGPTLALENVYFMLQLDRGAAMASLVRRVEQLGYRWAYRVVNTMSFDLPQRRRRVFFVASPRIDPRAVLFADDAPPPKTAVASLAKPLGFYWTEGRNGVGLAVDAIPPLKVASGWGIPSTPAVLFEDGKVLTPSITACERLQGFPPGWTDLDLDARRSPRWSMVGNAISVPAATWLAHRLKNPGRVLDLATRELTEADRWPTAAYGEGGKSFAVLASEFPMPTEGVSITSFRGDDWKPLSIRALAGFIHRAKTGGLRFPPGFLAALEAAVAEAVTTRS